MEINFTQVSIEHLSRLKMVFGWINNGLHLDLEIGLKLRIAPSRHLRDLVNLANLIPFGEVGLRRLCPGVETVYILVVAT